MSGFFGQDSDSSSSEYEYDTYENTTEEEEEAHIPVGSARGLRGPGIATTSKAHTRPDPNTQREAIERDDGDKKATRGAPRDNPRQAKPDYGLPTGAEFLTCSRKQWETLVRNAEEKRNNMKKEAERKAAMQEKRDTTPRVPAAPAPVISPQVQTRGRVNRDIEDDERQRKRAANMGSERNSTQSGTKSFFASSGTDHGFFKEQLCIHDSLLFTILSRPFQGELRPGEDEQLFVIPRQFRDNSSFKIHTEPQVLMAFESSLKYYRESGIFMDRDANVKLGSGSMDEYYTGDRTPIYMGVPVKIHKMDDAFFFAWYYSPTLNWKIDTMTTTKRMIYKYLHESSIITQEDRERLRTTDRCVPSTQRLFEKDGKAFASTLDDYIRTPESFIVACFSVRLEVIMLAYRYATMVVNMANKEYSNDMEQPHDGSGQSDACNYTKRSEDIRTLMIDYETKTAVTEKLGRAFSMMHNVVHGMLGSWTTLETPAPCAELTKECCLFMQYLIVGIRLLYVIRLLRLKHFLNLARKGENSEDDVDGCKYDGLGHIEWAKLSMGAANCFLRAHQIYSEFLDIMYGNKRRSGGDPAQKYPACVHIMRTYLEKSILFNLTRGLSFFILDNKNELNSNSSMPPYCGGGKPSPEYKRQMNLPYQNFVLAQIGLVCIRPFLSEKERYLKYSWAIEMEGFFNDRIKETFPKVTGDGGNQPQRPRIRIVNHTGLMSYLPFVKEYFDEDINTNYGFNGLTPFFKKYLYTYPSEPTHIYPNYITSIAYHLKMPRTAKVTETTVPSVFITHNTHDEEKKKWQSLVKSATAK